MKKLIAIILVLTLLCTFCLSGCSSPKTVEITEDSVVITISSKVLEITDTTTLVEYMNKLQENGDLSFSISDGMVTQINDITPKKSANEFWALYTNDEEKSNSAWGEFVFEDVAYASASFGANELVVKEDCVYIWTIRKF